MTDDIPTSMAEAMAEIRRLRVRIMEYEAQAAVAHGTQAKPTEDEPATYTHNIPPSAPPHVGHTINWPPLTGDDHE